MRNHLPPRLLSVEGWVLIEKLILRRALHTVISEEAETAIHRAIYADGITHQFLPPMLEPAHPFIAALVRCTPFPSSQRLYTFTFCKRTYARPLCICLSLTSHCTGAPSLTFTSRRPGFPRCLGAYMLVCS